MTTGKTIALTRQTFVGKVMSLLFNMLSRLVITFHHWLQRNKRLKQSSFAYQIIMVLRGAKQYIRYKFIYRYKYRYKYTCVVCMYLVTQSMGILWARILEWVAMPSSRGSSQSRDRITHTPCILINGILCAISVNKGCHSHQRLAATTRGWTDEPWGNSGCENTGYSPQIAEVHVKEMISLSPDLPIHRKALNSLNLRCLVSFY